MIDLGKFEWLKSIFSQEINNCTIRIYNKISYYEIYITYYESQLCNEIRKTVKDIAEKIKLNNFMIGHGNVMLEINSGYDRIEIHKIIMEITELFSDKNTELIESMEIDNVGNLIVKPKNKTFENIYKVGNQVKWNNDEKFIYSYIPEIINWNLTLEDIVEAVYNQYKIILKINKETIYKNDFWNRNKLLKIDFKRKIEKIFNNFFCNE
jgi:hypothetical protein